MLPPSDVYFAALCSTLLKIWLRREKSPNTQIGVSGACTANAWRFESTSGRTISRLCSSTLPSSTASRCRVILPCVMRETSSKSSTSPARCVTCRSMTSRTHAMRDVVRRNLAEHLRGRDDRRERIAQLVRQHREELVLAPARFLQLLLGVFRARHLALQAAVELRIVERDRGARRDLEQAALVEGRRLVDRPTPSSEHADVALADLERQHVREPQPRRPMAASRRRRPAPRARSRRSAPRSSLAATSAAAAPGPRAGAAAARSLPIRRHGPCVRVDRQHRAAADGRHQHLEQPLHARLEVRATRLARGSRARSNRRCASPPRRRRAPASARATFAARRWAR